MLSLGGPTFKKYNSAIPCNEFIACYFRYTHNEKRYHSEVRQEAVQQALAAMQIKPKPTVPMPSKRSSVMKSSQHESGNL